MRERERESIQDRHRKPQTTREVGTGPKPKQPRERGVPARGEGANPPNKTENHRKKRRGERERETD